MVNITLELEVDKQVIDKFNGWIEDIREQMKEYDKENGTTSKYSDAQILGDILNDVLIFGTDPILTWNSDHVNVDY